jgi:hypothetical protein
MNPGKLDIYGYIEYPTGTKNKGLEGIDPGMVAEGFQIRE